MQVEVGQKAPDFTLPDTDRKPRSLKEFLGKKAIMAFFCGAFTPVCTKEMCTLNERSLERLAKLNSQVIGICVDSPFAIKAFAEKNGLTIPLLSDYNREVVGLYGIELPDFAGMKGYTAAKRSVFILDKEGMVSYKWVSDDPLVEPNYDEIVQQLEKIP